MLSRKKTKQNKSTPFAFTIVVPSCGTIEIYEDKNITKSKGN
jgi:hypothetical protein